VVKTLGFSEMGSFSSTRLRTPELPVYGMFPGIFRRAPSAHPRLSHPLVLRCLLPHPPSATPDLSEHRLRGVVCWRKVSVLIGPKPIFSSIVFR
jgi:hypothetical protein